MSETNSLNTPNSSTGPSLPPDCEATKTIDATGHVFFERIGVGGMGEVYRCGDDALQRDLAIKVLRAELRGNADAEEVTDTIQLEGRPTMNRLAIGGSVALLFIALAQAQETPSSTKKAATPDSLKAEIESLKAAKVAWREIAWKSCLLEGLREARAKNKPALLWVFIDRPTDDARC
jgi:hypothetical protein